MARRKTKPRPLTLKAMMTLEPELDGVCRQLAALALAQLEQESPLGVRQTEQLRRALTTAGTPSAGRPPPRTVTIRSLT